MSKFILNRPDDFVTMSRKRLILTTLKWFFPLMIGAVLLRIVCVAIYMSQGVNPMELTKFGGDPTTHMDHASWKIILTLMLVAPVMEEVMFRLGLSFRRITVALWAGLTPLVCAAYLYHCRVWYILLGMGLLGVVLFWLVHHYTTDEQWGKWRAKFIIPAMWVSAISFGLIHLMAFTVLNCQLLPFALATILIPMAGGCAITYARVNLGFWWGVLLHLIINIPPVLMISLSLLNQS